jgi:hypothetical protein
VAHDSVELLCKRLRAEHPVMAFDEVMGTQSDDQVIGCPEVKAEELLLDAENPSQWKSEIERAHFEHCAEQDRKYEAQN